MGSVYYAVSVKSVQTRITFAHAYAVIYADMHKNMWQDILLRMEL